MTVNELTDKQKVKELKVLVQTCERTKARNSNEYLKGTLTDKSGSIGFKVWNNLDSMETILKPGNAVIIKDGVVDSYKGTLDLKIAVAEKCKGAVKNLVPSTYLDEEAIESRLGKIMTWIKEDDIDIAPIIKTLKETDLWEAFMTVPAAIRHHHAYRGGLITHTLEACEIAYNMAYTLRGDPNVKVDIGALLCAALFHDIGKIPEYVADDVSGLFTDQTLNGQLMGHHFLSTNFVNKQLGPHIDPRRLELVQHCILSHHGRREWDAAVDPKTIEAVILHCADWSSSQAAPRTQWYKDELEK